ncbi:ABC transporter permease subunit [Mycoplasma tauri]|uniref:ABC transporter permease subunit n=1 Tax=Mycoplasma tauri TaxID=547987 RepID=UPI0019680593|nr:ABC transporter permease subunit [Mycoplasma tauri]QSB07245.1 ABC transporter permease subunit [Mycoplasma tauri]
MPNKFGLQVFSENLKNFFSFSYKSTLFGKNNEWLWKISFEYLWETVKYAMAGTFIGFVFANITAFGTSKRFTNKYWSFISRNFILFIRAIPELVFINYFINVYHSHATLTFIFLFFSWLWLHKYFSDILNNMDLTPYKIAIYHGLSPSRAFITQVWPRVINRFINLGFYSLESNIKWNTILSTLGIVGIGQLITHGTGANKRQWSELGIPVFVLLSFIILLEIFSFLIKKYFLEDTTKLLKDHKLTGNYKYKKLANHINYKFWIKIFAAVTISIFSIVIIALNNNEIKNVEYIKTFIKQLFNADFSVFNITSFNVADNPILMILQSLVYSLMFVLFSLILLLIILYFSNSKINKNYKYVSIRSLIAISRIIPIIIIFKIFSPIVKSDFTLLILISSIHASSSLIKQMSEASDNIDDYEIMNLKIKGYSNWYIYWKYILPTIKYDLITWTFLYFELAFRNSITYASLSSGSLTIGNKINEYMNLDKGKDISKAFAYIWISTITILIINYLSEVYTKKHIKDNDIYKHKTSNIFSRFYVNKYNYNENR